MRSRPTVLLPKEDRRGLKGFFDITMPPISVQEMVFRLEITDPKGQETSPPPYKDPTRAPRASAPANLADSIIDLLRDTQER